MRITKEQLARLRGGHPTHCTFCRKLRHFDELEPEEAGAWVCHDCLRRWLKSDIHEIKKLLAKVYGPLDAAKWWFTPQPEIADRTPHELLLSDQSEYLLDELKRVADGTHE